MGNKNTTCMCCNILYAAGNKISQCHLDATTAKVKFTFIAIYFWMNAVTLLEKDYNLTTDCMEG